MLFSNDYLICFVLFFVEVVYSYKAPQLKHRPTVVKGPFKPYDRTGHSLDSTVLP